MQVGYGRDEKAGARSDIRGDQTSMREKGWRESEEKRCEQRGGGAECASRPKENGEAQQGSKDDHGLPGGLHNRFEVVAGVQQESPREPIGPVHFVGPAWM